MIQPIEYKTREPLNSLTGIKSSLSNLRSVVSLTYLLFVVNGKRDQIDYANSVNNDIVIKPQYKDAIKKFLKDDSLDNVIDGNPLCKSQIESLYVGITLMFGFGRIEFEDEKLPMTKERTGGIRYPKRIHFASNIIALDIILQGIEENDRIGFLKSWLKDEHLNSQIELNVATYLNLCIENNLFKLRLGDTDLFFQTEGLYEGLRKDNTVSLESDEKVGPMRILNSMLSEGLVPWLTMKRSEISYNNSTTFDYDSYSKIISTSLDIRDIKVDRQNSYGAQEENKTYGLPPLSENDIITALRTKPFLLLAGISGTGKSQKVQELAFMSCPEELREENSTTPGNYCLVEVKPNWHDSTELLGYYSALSGRYELTDFIRFTYKAQTNANTPFFLCLDEMNLAPVEQYFAEYLSVLETRKRVIVDGKVRIQTEPLLTKDKFSNCRLNERVPKQTTGYTLDGDEYDEKPLYSPDDAEIIAYLKNNGLHLPDNLFVIGTVNMDDTTHQFSRKVIDRAFTIEMNGGKMDEMFSTESRNNLEYRAEPLPLSAFKSEFVRAYEVLEDDHFAKYADTITTEIPKLLGNSDGTASEDSINGILNGTPFRVSYRVQNELVLYLSVLIENAGFPDDIESLIGEATLAILMEKVLPRIQGEQKQLETKGGKSNVLKDMKSFVETRFKPSDETVPEIYDKVIKKLDEMDGKLSGYYTNFF